MKLLEHKGMLGTVEYSEEDHILFGQISGIRGLVLYEGATIDELTRDFRDAVEGYLSYCDELDIPNSQVSAEGELRLKISVAA